MVFIYILELENKKYYVGKTTNPDFRLEQHFNSSGSEWTKKYKPKKVLKLFSNCDNFDEDKYTLKFMEKYGINNVRGGSFCEFKLDKDNLQTIKKMITGSTDKCYICGENGHFARDCYQDEDNLLDLLIVNDLCFRCYRKGHYASDCYANTTITGEEIEDSSDEEMEVSSDEEMEVSSDEEMEVSSDEEMEVSSDEEMEIFYCSYCDKEFDTLRGVTCHENLYCKNKNSKTKSKPKNICYRCGREGHYSTDCYASKHINGKYLT